MSEVKFEKVETREMLRSVAYQWAVKRHLDPVLYSETVDNLFPHDSDLPTYRHIIETSLLHFDGRKSEQIRYYEEIIRFHIKFGATWSLETLKHLFLLNAAGLAGAITLYTQTHINNSFSTYAAVMFALGIALSLFGFWAGSRTFLMHATAYAAVLEPLRQSNSWESFGSIFEDANDFEKKIKRSTLYRKCSTCSGWVSVFITTVALGLLGAAFWTAHP